MKDQRLKTKKELEEEIIETEDLIVDLDAQVDMIYMALNDKELELQEERERLEDLKDQFENYDPSQEDLEYLNWKLAAEDPQQIRMPFVPYPKVEATG